MLTTFLYIFLKNRRFKETHIHHTISFILFEIYSSFLSVLSEKDQEIKAETLAEFYKNKLAVAFTSFKIKFE
jgi:hypothetical protein